MDFKQTLGFAASIILPFFNIPLMLRMYQRKSSEDLSLVWVCGIFFSLLAMIPVGIQSPDSVFRLFSVLNFAFFSGVAGMAVYYRIKKK